jgi:hypothetical protein
MLAERPKVFQLLRRQVLNADKGVLRRAAFDQFIEFHLYRGTVAVLRILNEKGNDRCPCIDDQLPSIGIVKEWA